MSGAATGSARLDTPASTVSTAPTTSRSGEPRCSSPSNPTTPAECRDRRARYGPEWCGSVDAWFCLMSGAPERHSHEWGSRRGCCVTLDPVADSMRAEPVEAMLFDLGGVVITIDFGRCFQRWADSAGCAADDLASRFVFDSAYEDHERGTLDAAAYWAKVRNSLSLSLADDLLLAGWNDIYVGADLEVLALLLRARAEWPLYAFTNSNPAHQAVWAERFAADLDVFETVFVSSELGHRKPDRAAFEAVVASIGVPASRILSSTTVWTTLRVPRRRACRRFTSLRRSRSLQG